MSKAGLGEDIIVEQIKRSGQSFELTADQLIDLKTSGVSDPVIRAMLNPAGASASAVAPSSAQLSPSGYPTEIGVYAKRKGKWVDVMPEIVNIKTGGVVKSLSTAGIVKGDLNGHLQGAHSSLQVAQPLELLVVVPEGVGMTEYQLLRLRRNGNNREFRTITGGVFHVSSGATRDLVDFKWSKVANRTFAIELVTLNTGEYGILPPSSLFARNAAGSTGKLYTFSLPE